MESLKRSWQLAKSSWEVLKADRELVILPLLSLVISLVAGAIFLGLVFLVDYDSATGLENFELSPVGGGLLIALGLTLAIVGTFFQAAMVSGARERITGGDPTVASAIASASSRLGVIIPWAIFSWTVGAVLRAIEERAGAVGRFVVGFIGMAFRVVTFLAVPVLVVEQLGPIATLKRSAELFRQTWGENLAAQVGIGLVTFAALVPGVLIAVLVGAATSPVLGIILAVPWIVLVVAITTCLTAIFQTALYHYVTTREVPAGFENASLETAFRTR